MPEQSDIMLHRPVSWLMLCMRWVECTAAAGSFTLITGTDQLSPLMKTSHVPLCPSIVVNIRGFDCACHAVHLAWSCLGTGQECNTCCVLTVYNPEERCFAKGGIGVGGGDDGPHVLLVTDRNPGI